MKRLFFIIVSVILLLSIPLSLHAQEKEVTLQEVVVTATRDVQEIRKIPANVTVVTREEIEQSNAQTTIDLLRHEAGVVVGDWFGTGKSASVDIRGFGETGLLNTLVLVDGRRVNAIDLSGVDWSQIPLEQVERIEIVRGPSSVLYGDNAVGGVINIITKKPEKPLSIEAGITGGSYKYNKESALVGGKWGPLSALLHADYNSTEGYRENGFFRAKDIGGRLVYDMNEFISFNFSGSFHRDDTGFPGYLTKALYKQDRRATLFPDDKGETDDGYGALGVKAKLWDFGRIEIDLSYRHREVADFLPSFSFEDKRNLSTWGFTPKYIIEKSLWNHFNKLIFGSDFYRSKSDVDSVSGFFGPNRSEVTKKSVGLYLLDEFSILENLILSFGYRNEWVTYDLFQQAPVLKERVKEQEPAWNIGLDYLFNKRSSAFFNIKRSFRFPVSDELLQFFPMFQVNPMMEPQTGYHYEVGIRHFFTDQIETNLTLFWIDLRDEIFYNPFTFTNENYPKTRRQGLEMGARVKPLPWLSVWGNYSYIRPVLRGDSFSGNDIPGVPRHKGSMGADIELGRGFLFNARGNIVGSRRFIADWANKVERLDGYYTLDVKLSYAWKGLKAFVGVNNLFNRKYAEFAVVDAAGSQFYYPSPERNFIGGISYTF